MSCVDQGAFRLIVAACKQARQAAVDGSIESERVSSTVTGLSVDMSMVGPLKQRISAARSWSYTQYILVVLCRNLLIVESKIFFLPGYSDSNSGHLHNLPPTGSYRGRKIYSGGGQCVLFLFEMTAFRDRITN